MADIDRIRSKIKADPRFKKIRSIVKTNRVFNFSVVDYQEEAARMFKMRRFRDLDTDSATFIRDLNKAYSQDLSYRSRMTEMYVACNSARGYLNRLLSAFYDYAIMEYYSDLKSVGTAEERKRFLSSILRTQQDLIQSYDMVCEELDFYMKDIDKCGFGATSMANTQVMLSKNGGRESL
jgi:hypothetical protein